MESGSNNTIIRYSGLDFLIMLINIIGIPNFDVPTFLSLRLVCKPIADKTRWFWKNFGNFTQHPIFIFRKKDTSKKMKKDLKHIMYHNIVYIYDVDNGLSIQEICRSFRDAHRIIDNDPVQEHIEHLNSGYFEEEKLKNPKYVEQQIELYKKYYFLDFSFLGSQHLDISDILKLGERYERGIIFSRTSETCFDHFMLERKEDYESKLAVLDRFLKYEIQKICDDDLKSKLQFRKLLHQENHTKLIGYCDLRNLSNESDDDWE